MPSEKKRESLILNLGQRKWFLSQENGTKSYHLFYCRHREKRNQSMPKVIVKYNENTEVNRENVIPHVCALTVLRTMHTALEPSRFFLPFKWVS